MNITACPREREYYALLLPVMARGGILLSNVLRVGGRPVAYSLCYAAGDRVGQVKTSFDESYAKERPGFLATVASVRRAAAEGFREYDFLGDAMRHKFDWTDEARAHRAHVIFRRSPRGLVLAAAKRFIRRVKRSSLGRAAHSETASGREN
jgi:CelD/BcsL family acetyltransferase involved in cellulose biosynthesis